MTRTIVEGPIRKSQVDSFWPYTRPCTSYLDRVQIIHTMNHLAHAIMAEAREADLPGLSYHDFKRGHIGPCHLTISTLNW